MNKFEKDFYNFVTAEENFEAAYDIAMKFEGLKEELIERFWKNVFSILKVYEKDLDGWYSYSDFLEDGEDLIGGLYHEKYTNSDDKASIGTCFYLCRDGRIMLGIYFDKDVNAFKNYEKVREFAGKMIKNDWRVGPSTDSFPIYKFMEDNFKSYETLRKILPSSGDELAKEYAEVLINAHKELYPLIEKFGGNFK